MHWVFIIYQLPPTSATLEVCSVIEFSCNNKVVKSTEIACRQTIITCLSSRDN